MCVKVILTLYIAVSVIGLITADSTKSVFCQRFPTNPNCVSSPPSSSGSASAPRLVDPQSLGLPPPPGSSPPQPANSGSDNNPCQSWKPVYDKYCVGGSVPPEYKPSCAQYAQTCVGGAGAGAGAAAGTGAGTGNAGTETGSNSDPCTSWKPVYDQKCVGNNVSPDYQPSCNQFKQQCLGGGSSSSQSNDPCASWKPVYEKYCLVQNVQTEYQSSCAQYQQRCGGGGGFGAGAGAGTQPQGSGSNVGSTWAALTQKAQEEQAQQALIDAQNGAANCGQYKDNFNVWCGGVKQVNALYCNTLGRVCAEQAQRAAAGQSNVGGPFAGNNGLPTGGAGSTRPLTIGNNFGVGPFFGMDRTLGINPLQGVGQRQGFNVPIAGIGVQSSRGVDWGGLPGIAQLGAALGGRRRRWAIPLGLDQYGNVVYFV